MTTEAEYAQRRAEHLSPVGTLTNEQLKHTAELFDKCVATDRTDVTADNSFFGEMNWREWFYFLRFHVLAHVDQMQKLRGTAGFPTS